MHLSCGMVSSAQCRTPWTRQPHDEKLSHLTKREVGI
jgi:hypothetical protein